MKIFLADTQSFWKWFTENVEAHSEGNGWIASLKCEVEELGVFGAARE